MKNKCMHNQTCKFLFFDEVKRKRKRISCCVCRRTGLQSSSQNGSEEQKKYDNNINNNNNDSDSNNSKQELEQPLNKKRKENRLMQKKLPRGDTCNKSNDNDTNKDANADEIVDVRVLAQDIDNGRCKSMSECTQQRQDKLCYMCRKQEQSNAKSILTTKIEENMLCSCKHCFRCCHIQCLHDKRPFVGCDAPAHDLSS